MRERLARPLVSLPFTYSAPNEASKRRDRIFHARNRLAHPRRNVPALSPDAISGDMLSDKPLIL